MAPSPTAHTPTSSAAPAGESSHYAAHPHPHLPTPKPRQQRPNKSKPLRPGSPRPLRPAAPLDATPRAQRKPVGRSGRGGSASASAAARDTRPCCECGRRFSTWKALLGHFRCRGDLPWSEQPRCPFQPSPAGASRPRGMAPGEQAGAAATEADMEAANCLIFLNGGGGGELPPYPLEARQLFRCSSCNKVFHTMHGVVAPAGDASPKKRRVMEGGSEYRCAVCSLYILAGQALRGLLSSQPEERDGPQLLLTLGASSSDESAVDHRFDLNQHPAAVAPTFGELPANGYLGQSPWRHDMRYG